MTDFVDLRRRIVQAAFLAQSGHVPSAFSILEIVWTLYNKVISPDDIFVLSKGHGALALYAVLDEQGKLDLSQFGKTYGGHPDLSVPGVLIPSGSLGHGLPAACGLALAKKIKGEPGRVYVLCGDGEMQEGSNWEALRVAEKLDLPVVLIVDDNDSCGGDTLQARLNAAGFGVAMAHGHSVKSLERWLICNVEHYAVICQTVKGKGCTMFEQDPEAWHHRAPTAEELPGILAEIP